MISKRVICTLFTAVILTYSLSACKSDQTEQTSSTVSEDDEEEVIYILKGNATETPDNGVYASSVTESEAEGSPYDNIEFTTVSPTDTDSYENPFLNADANIEDLMDMSWFDDAVFIGDSMLNKLGLYNDVYMTFGNAKFVCAPSLSYGNAQWDLYDANAVHPTYNGSVILAEDIINQTGASKAIIGLGMNDIGNYGIDGAIENASSFIDRLLTKSPNAEIYILSVTPMINSAQYDRLNNEAIREFNQKLKDLVEGKGLKFLDTYSIFEDAGGNLPLWLCSDPDDLGIHFTDEACWIWEYYLKSNLGK